MSRGTVSGNGIVTDGLVLALDAANPRSYVSGSSVWRDMVSSDVTGSLVNAPTFNSDNGGVIVFDGVNDYVSTSLQNIERPCTFSIWINLISLSGWMTFFGQDTSVLIPRGRFYFQKANSTGEGAIQNRVNFSLVTSGGNIVVANANNNITINKWYNYCASLTTTTISLYENGILQNTTNDSNSFLTPNTSILVGAGYYNNAIVDYIAGKIPNVQIYNRALSAQEILQNYNATKTRFGL